MFKLMSVFLSMQMGETATVTDSEGNTIEIEDEFLTVYTIPSDNATFQTQWHCVDDRVMGGKSYSYVDLENGYGKFYGIASSDGGGFSAVGNIDYS